MIFAIEAAHAAKPNRTGVEEYCFQIIQSLKTTVPVEVRVVLYVKEATTIFDPLPQNWTLRVLPWPLGKLWSQIRLSFELLLHPPDIFFAPGQLIPFFCPRKTVVMVHDSAFKVVPQVYRFWGRQYLKWMNKRILKHATTIITSSFFNKRELVRLYGGKYESKIRVVPLAYDVTKYFSSTTTRAPRPAQITKPYVVSVGRLEAKKNTRVLVEAFNKVRAAGTDLQLVLAGIPGVGYKTIHQAILASPYREDIIELGYVAGDVVPGLVAGSRAFLFPSVYEGFGIPVLEAMAVGVPVVCSDIPALREVAGEAALFAPVTDAVRWAEAIQSLFIEEEERTLFKEAALQRAKSFSWLKTAQLTWNELKKTT